MTPDQLAQYISVMREHNVTAFKTGEIEITLGPAPAGAAPSNPAPRRNDYDKLLFAATEGLPEDDDE